MNCVNGAALGPKASSKAIECIEAAPCAGVARYSVRAVVIEFGWVLLVQSCTAIVCGLSHPLISITMPSGANRLLREKTSLYAITVLCEYQ